MLRSFPSIDASRLKRVLIPLFLGALSLCSIGARVVWNGPPRFDGAGYAILAESLRTGRGYHAIDQINAPPHAHFPPLYPIVLATIWRVTGRSAIVAHLFSVMMTVGAVLFVWNWLSRRFPGEIALPLAAALSINWAWGRTGGAIQSEPMFLFLSTWLLAAADSGSRARDWDTVGFGLLGAACILTRHVGAAWVLAIGLNFLLQKEFRSTLLFVFIVIICLSPWLAWLVTVREGTQMALLPRQGLPSLVVSQGQFYLERIPDQITGPIVEVATIFRPEWRVPAKLWAVVVSMTITLGWFLCLASKRARKGGLIPLVSMALLLVWPFTEAGRFLIPLIPFILLGGAKGAAWGLARFGLGRRSALRVSSWVLLALSVPYSALALATRKEMATEQAQAPFDAACRWIATNGPLPGAVISRQGGEAFWLMGCKRAIVAPPETDDTEGIEQSITHAEIAYLIDDSGRFAGSHEGAVKRFIQGQPERVRLVRKEGPISVYELIPAAVPRANDPR